MCLHVKLDDNPLDEYASLIELEDAENGWFYDPDDRMGIAHIKTHSISTNTEFNVVLDIPVGADAIKIKDKLKVFPNPTADIVSITAEDVELIQISVYDFNGRLINDSIHISQGLNSAEIDLSNQSNGIYYLDIKTHKGQLRSKVTLMK